MDIRRIVMITKKTWIYWVLMIYTDAAMGQLE